MKEKHFAKLDKLGYPWWVDLPSEYILDEEIHLFIRDLFDGSKEKMYKMQNGEESK